MRSRSVLPRVRPGDLLAVILLAGCAGERVREDELAGDWAVLVWEDEVFPAYDEEDLGFWSSSITEEAAASFVGDLLVVTTRSVRKENDELLEITTTETRGTIRRRAGHRLELAMIPRDGSQPYALNCALWEPGELTCVHPEGAWQSLSLLSREPL